MSGMFTGHGLLEGLSEAEKAELSALLDSLSPKELEWLAARPEVQPFLGDVTDSSFDSPYELAYRLTSGKEQQRPHLAAFDDLLVRAATEGNVRAIVSAPPRHGKTQRISKWGSLFYLLKQPTHRIMVLSYSSDLSADATRFVMGHINARPELGLRIRRDARAAARFLLDRYDVEAGMYAQALSGTLTGRGANLIILDDPIKDAMHALSPKRKQVDWERWQTVVDTRLEPNGSIIIVSTRWASDDIPGRILAEPALAEGWEHHNFRALAEKNDVLGREEGEALWPTLWSKNKLEKIRLTRSAYWWFALYQGTPKPAGASNFEEKDVRRFRPSLVPGYVDLITDNGIVSKQIIHRLMTVDVASSMKETADYTVASTFDFTADGDLVWRGMERKRVEGPDQIPLIRRQHLEFGGLHIIWIESVAYQQTLVQAALRAGLPAMPLATKGDKLSRSYLAQALWLAHKVFIPVDATWAPEALKELGEFPRSEHDDIVDTLSYAAILMSNWEELAGNGIAQELN
jgi:predicted phage terminase large subunit-like protein